VHLVDRLADLLDPQPSVLDAVREGFALVHDLNRAGRHDLANETWHHLEHDPDDHLTRWLVDNRARLRAAPEAPSGGATCT
jgi:hypothetical protein